MSKNTSQAQPIPQTGRERRASAKAQAMAEEEAARVSARNKATQRSDERATKKARKQTKAAEVERLRQEAQHTSNTKKNASKHVKAIEVTRHTNRENKAPSPTATSRVTVRANQQDTSFAVRNVNEQTKTSTPRINLVPQRGTVPRPPLAPQANTANKPAKKLTPAKAAYLLSLRAEQEDENNSRSPSPSDGELFDDAIAGLADIDMDDNTDYPKLFQNSSSDTIEEPAVTSSRTASKRPRSDDNQSDTGEWRTAIKLTNVAGKPAAKHWEREVQDVLAEAIWVYENKLLVNGFFPDHMQEITWAKAAWVEGCHECGVKIHHNMELIKLLTGRATHLRGVIKSKARSLTEASYGFQVSGSGAVDHNRKVVSDMKKDFAFVYRVPPADGQPGKGLYEHPIIQRVTNKVFFGNGKTSPGVRFTKCFSPFPDTAMAIILAAVENSIDEFGNGIQTNIPFTAEAYKSNYEEHLQMLDHFEEHTKDVGILPKILQRLHDNGRKFAKAEPLAIETVRTISFSAFDAAIKEFKNRDGNLSDDERDDVMDDNNADQHWQEVGNKAGEKDNEGYENDEDAWQEEDAGEDEQDVRKDKQDAREDEEDAGEDEEEEEEAEEEESPAVPARRRRQAHPGHAYPDPAY